MVEIVKLGNIRCKLDGIKYQTKDQLNHQLSVNDLVKVVEGVWRVSILTACNVCLLELPVLSLILFLILLLQGRTGKIVHIYKGNLFIYDHHHLENAGFMCAKSQSCILLAGGSRATNNWNVWIVYPVWLVFICFSLLFPVKIHTILLPCRVRILAHALVFICLNRDHLEAAHL